MPEEMSTIAVSDEAIVETFGERLELKLHPKGYYGFDPTLIITIISVIVTVIQNCKKPTPAAIKRRGLLIRARLNLAIGQQLPNLKWKERGDLIDDVFSVADDSDDKEIERFVSACCN